MPEQPANAAQIAYWNDRVAVTWTTFQERLDGLFEPLTALALDAAAPVAGERIIDVGCGCGATVLALATRVGPSGRVLGLDVSEHGGSSTATDRDGGSNQRNGAGIRCLHSHFCGPRLRPAAFPLRRHVL